MATIYLGLGSNLGEREGNLKRALDYLATNNILVKKISSFLETEPLGGPPQGKYLNAVLKARTELSAEELLCAVKTIEKKMGRTPNVRNGPRVIDIDILLYDRQCIRSLTLTIPHPRMLERDFVMIPLKEIAPGMTKELLHANDNPHSLTSASDRSSED